MRQARAADVHSHQNPKQENEPHLQKKECIALAQNKTS